MIRFISAFLVGSLCLSGNPVSAGPLSFDETQLTASDADKGDQFANNVAASGDTIVVGTWNDPSRSGPIPKGAEAAYVFVRSGDSWIEEAILTANDGAEEDAFGGSVAISGDTIVVGAQGDDDDGFFSGSVYVFVRSGTVWSLQQKLTANDARGNDEFGSSVAIEGDTLVVGAWRGFGQDSGSAYVFVRAADGSWTQQAKLTHNDPAREDNFGFAVALSGDTVVVGTPQVGLNATNQQRGAAYVYVRSGTTWTQEQKLTASDSSKQSFFGGSVTLLGDTAVIGAPGANKFKGSTYVFTRSGTTWTEQHILRGSDVGSLDFFGTAVGFNGDILAVGAAGDRNFTGSAYLFGRSGDAWIEQGKITAKRRSKEDFFGDTLALNGDTLVIGAARNDSAGRNTGSAYVYDLVVNSYQGILAGTRFCDDGLGTGTKKKIKGDVEFILDLSLFPIVTAEPKLEFLGGVSFFEMTGTALLKDKESGVLQLFSSDGDPLNLAVSANIKLNKKTGAWKSLAGNFQLLEPVTLCTFAGKFKAK